MEGETCFFRDVYKCGEGKLIKSKRLQTVSSASHLRDDGLSVHIAELAEDAFITCHKNCISRYVSPSNLASVKKREREHVPPSVSDAGTKRLRCNEGVVVFDFKKHCLFCHEVTPCSVEQDSKVPLKYRRAASLVRTDKLANGQDYKQKLLGVCAERSDQLGHVIRDRILGAGVSDLHALDARYHQKCCKQFHNTSQFNSDNSVSNVYKTADQQALVDTLGAIGEDRKKVWTSTEVEAVYTDNGGNEHSRRTLVKKVCEHFGDELIALQSPGIATLMVFREHAPKNIKLVDDDTEEDMELCLQKVAKQVAKESKDKKNNLDAYNRHIDKEIASACISDTVFDLLTAISPKFANLSLQSLMIGSIIASVVTNQPTPLQIAIGVLMSDHKGLIKELSKYNVTCSYDETRRFRRSAAGQAAKANLIASMSDCSVGGLVQIIIDNFDADISSQNCRLQCHCMAMLNTQYQAHIKRLDELEPDSIIPRLTKEEMKRPIACETPITAYRGTKKPEMPLAATYRYGMAEKHVASQVVSQARARDIDFSFLKDVLFKEGTPEYNGYNTRICREAGMSPAPKSVLSYLPLLNMKPTDPTTVLTSITRGFELTRDANQDILVITADAAIYKIIVDISFHQTDLLGNMVALLGGMHLLMDFVACIGTLTTDCGLKEVLSTFGSVDKMMSGKKYPQNVRAIRLLVEELLRPVFKSETITSMDDLEEELEKRSSQSRTAKMWVAVVIRPVLIIMLYCRASYESDWLLHLKATEMMLPYMFAAHKYNYSRYGLYYVRSMSRIHPDILARFCKGQQSLHHTAGLWNGEWSDMFIETTWMRKGHGPGGIIGNTQNPQTMATWVYSMDAVMTLTGRLKKMGDSDTVEMKEKHKEEFPSRIRHDGDDRRAIRQALASFVDPLDPESHGGESLLNIVSGKLANPEVNVDNSVEIGTTMIREFEASWPDGFRAPISKRVVTFAEKKKRLRIAGQDVMDPEAIYNRVIGLLVSQRDLDLQAVFATELTAYPPSMFYPDGTMRIATGKSILKKNLQVETSQRNALTLTAIVVDVSALLWTLAWPVHGTVETFIAIFKVWLSDRITASDVYLCFDRYHDYSIKSSTRNSRSTTARVFKLTLQTPLPSRDAILKNYTNKVQLNKLLCQQILADNTFLQAATDSHVLVVTGDKSIPTQVDKGRKSARMDLVSSLEEADNIIAQQVVAIGTNPDARVLALADDTDVFVLLLFFYGRSSLQSTIYMQSPVYGRYHIDIKAAYLKHSVIVPDLLAIHALSGCDSVAATYGIGKTTALTIASKGHRLSLLGDVTAEITSVLEQATAFMAACYGVKTCSSMSECRQYVWAQKTGKASAAPKLCSLPPTTEAFHENVLRAHLQVANWRAALSGEPPAMDPVQFGWEADHVNKCLIPRNMRHGTAYAPEHVLKLVRCGCDSEKACRGGNCGCMSRQLPCTIFCACGGGSGGGGVCHNPFNQADDGEDYTEEPY